MYFILFKSNTNNQWYWQFRAANHNNIATGSEGYVNKQDALHGINLVKSNATTATIFDDSTKQYL